MHDSEVMIQACTWGIPRGLRDKQGEGKKKYPRECPTSTRRKALDMSLRTWHMFSKMGFQSEQLGCAPDVEASDRKCSPGILVCSASRVSSRRTRSSSLRYVNSSAWPNTTSTWAGCSPSTCTDTQREVMGRGAAVCRRLCAQTG